MARRSAAAAAAIVYFASVQSLAEISMRLVSSRPWPEYLTAIPQFPQKNPLEEPKSRCLFVETLRISIRLYKNVK